MKWIKTLLLGASIFSSVRSLNNYTVPPGSPGFQHGNSTQAIQFDSHSLFVDGKRIFLFSGEFHPWRLPVPELWSDILQKMKAAAFSGVSIYVHWGLVEGKPGNLDWNHFRSIEEFYKIAQRVGLFVVVRPGPYINAETTGGGLPGWLTNMAAVARTNQTEYVNAWQSYVRDFAQITGKYQYPAGPVIGVQSENEFYISQQMNPTSTEAMILLENALRSNGVTKIPITANDVYPSGDFAAGPGEVDLYGFDAYPNGFDCANPSQWSELPNYFVSAHESSAPWAPMYLPEYQGGALDSWAGDGYDLCEQLTGPEFANVFYKSNVAFGSTAMSFYMIFGGTNWGNIAYPGVYTSYDYGGAIRETRLLTPKYNEIKLQGLFYHSSPSLLSSSIIGNGAGLPFTDNDEIFTTTLVSNTNETSYYVLRQTSNNITSPTSFHLNINTTMGTIRVPQYGGEITLQGRESKILVSEYQFGGSTLRYSTAEVMTHLTLDDIDYIVLYVLPGQYFEAVVLGSAISASKVTGALSVSARIVKNTVVISGTPSTKSPSLVRFGNTAVIILDKFTATSFWNPRLSATYDLSPDSPSVLIGGPYLVRNATVSGSTLNLVGDTNATTTLTIVAPRLVKSVTWNGDIVNISASPLGLGVVGIVPGPDALLLPNLRTSLWKSMDSLPEVNPNFDDSTWVTADKTSTARQQKPYSGKFVLYADEYGFHTGSFVYRGYFNGNFATGVNISAQGGSYFGFSVFVNAHFLGSNQGYVGADTANSTFSFPAGSLTNQNNVLTVITDSNGLDTDWNSNDLFKNPRGIRGYSLLGGGEFYQWKLSGNFRGEDFPDKVRGPLNEGGLWAERSGAVLPGYDDSEWGSSTPFEGVSKAGVSVYRTSFELNVPPGVDTSLALQFTRSPASDSEYRSLIYVNGWQFGKFISNFGPQTIFPVPEGILNHHGQNQIAVTLWSLSFNGAKIRDFELIQAGTLRSGKEIVSTGLVTSPTYQELRLV